MSSCFNFQTGEEGDMMMGFDKGKGDKDGKKGFMKGRDASQ